MNDEVSESDPAARRRFVGRLIIAGGRDSDLTQHAVELLDRLEITEVVSGCAPGVDTAGIRYAESRGIPVARFPADWKTHGRAAGPIRNREMARRADTLAAFRGGAGTRNMIRTAREEGMAVLDFTEDPATVVAINRG